MNKEPAVIAAGIAQLVSLIIPMLVLFNLIHWTAEQVAGFMAVVSFAATFVATLFTRQQSVPKVVADKQIDVALKETSSTTPEEVREMAAAKLAN